MQSTHGWHGSLPPLSPGPPPSGPPPHSSLPPLPPGPPPSGPALGSLPPLPPGPPPSGPPQGARLKRPNEHRDAAAPAAKRVNAAERPAAPALDVPPIRDTFVRSSDPLPIALGYRASLKLQTDTLCALGGHLPYVNEARYGKVAGKLMRKLGWEPGKGLGKDLSGAELPLYCCIEVKFQTDRKGLLISGEEVAPGQTDDDSLPRSRQFYCEMCQVSVSGSIPWKDHLEGQQHAKAMRLCRVANPLVADHARMQNGKAVVAVDAWGKPVAKSVLRPCEIAPGISENQESHLSTSNASSSTAGLSASPVGLVRADRSASAPAKANSFFCALCGVTCGNQCTFEAHLRGQGHASSVKRAEAQKTAGNAKCQMDRWRAGEDLCKPGAKPYAKDQKFHCKVCNVDMVGFIPWQQHLAGSKHKARASGKSVLKSNVKSAKPHTPYQRQSAMVER